MKNLKTFIVILFVFCSYSLYSIEAINSSTTISNPQQGVASLSVKLKITTLMGEPIISGTYKWTASSGYNTELHYSTKCVIELELTGGWTGSVFVALAPTVPKSGSGYGYNVSGSPSWSKVFLGSYDGTYFSNWLSADDAKSIVKNANLRIIGATLQSD